MGVRNPHSFSFPIRKFDDEVGLFTNFRYLERYLKNISSSNHQGPTLYVAATDATQTSKDMADYKCDGTADEVQIQAALDALPTTGGRVLLSEGTFTTAAQVNLPTSGSSSTILEGLGSVWKVAEGLRMIRGNGGFHTIRGFKITNVSRAGNTIHGMINGGDSRLVIENNFFTALTYKVIIGSETISDFGLYIITNNYFDDIILHDSGGGVERLGVFVEGGSGSRAQRSIFANNYLNNITKAAQSGSHDAHLVYSESNNGQALAIGNMGTSVNSLVWDGGDAIAMHNMSEDVHITGDHVITHASTTGQTTDDHHNEAHTVASHSDTTATGAELETLTDASDADSLHTHGAIQTLEEVQDIIGAMVSGNTETLITVSYEDGDGTLDFIVAESSIDHDALTNFVAAEHLLVGAIDHDLLLNFLATEHVAEASIDHGTIAGLTDDDHTQYPLKSIFTTAGDLWYATGSATPVRLGIGTASQILATNSGATAPEWVAAPTGAAFSELMLIGA